MLDVHECWKCKALVDEPLWKPAGDWHEYKPFHLDCLANSQKPQEHRVCDYCQKTGKDLSGNYPDEYISYKVVHPSCIDWDDVRKYGR